MNRYISLLIGGKSRRFQINDIMDREFRSLLKTQYSFDDTGVFNFHSDDLSVYYRVIQIVFQNLLTVLDNKNLPPEVQSKIDKLYDYTRNRGTVYNSDITELSQMFDEAYQVYDTLLENEAKPQEKASQKEEVSSYNEIESQSDLDTDDESSSLNLSDGSVKEEDNLEAYSTSSVQDSQDTKEETLDFNLDNGQEDSLVSSEDVKEEARIVLSALAEVPELQEYIREEETNQVVDRIVVTKTEEEFSQKAGVPIGTSVSFIQNSNGDIIVPPNTDVLSVAINMIVPAQAQAEILEVAQEYRNNKKEFNNRVTNSFNNLRTNIKLRGLSASNLNYFGNEFIKQYETICRETGTDFETMFRDYFSSSSNKRYNTALDKFIRLFIKANGGDNSLRELIEATIIKKATAAHLISNRYNNYLSGDYKYLDVNSNGNINYSDVLNKRVGGVNESSELNARDVNRGQATLSSDIPDSINGDRVINSRGENDFERRTEINTTSDINNSGKKVLNAPGLTSAKNEMGLSGKSQNNVQGLEKPNEGTLSPTINVVGGNNTGSVVSAFGGGLANGANGGNLEQGGILTDGSLAIDTDAVSDIQENSSIVQAKQVDSGKVIQFPTGGKINNKFKNNSKGGGIVNFKGGKKNSIINPTVMDDEESMPLESEGMGSDIPGGGGFPQNSDVSPDDIDKELLPDNDKDNVSLTDDKTAAEEIADDLADGAKEQVKKTLEQLVIEFIKKHPWVIGVVAGILFFLLVLLLILAYDQEQKRNAYYSQSSACSGEGGNLVSFIGGWEGVSGEACTINGLRGNKAVDQNDGTITVGAGVTNYLLSSLSSYISENNLGGYFNSSNGNYSMSVGDCIPTEVSDELKEVGVQTIYGAAVEEKAQELGIELTQYQKDALTSFNYNLGTGNTTKLLEAYRDQGYEGLWDVMKEYVHSQGKVLTGLQRRRKGEFALFVTGDYSDQGLFYSRDLANYDDYDSEGVMDREYYCTPGGGDGSLIAVNGFMQRITRPLRSNSYFYNQNNGLAYTDYEGECSWYAGHRAKEILGTIGSSKEWTSMPDGGKYCKTTEVTSGLFTISKNVNAPRPGSIISWTQGNRYGHVAVVEQVYSDGSILISEAYVSLGIYGKNARNTIHKYSNVREIRRKNCEGNGSGCFTTRKISADQIKNAGWSKGYNFDCYIYLDWRS